MDQLTRLDWLARAGYLARGIVYVLLGYFAWKTRSRDSQSPEGVFDRIAEMPAGKTLLFVLVAGLLAYGVYKLMSSLLDTDAKGHDAKGTAARVGIAAGGIAYLSMAWAATQVATGARAGSNGGGGQEAAGTLLDWPAGWLLLAAVGVGFLVAAAWQAKDAVKMDFMKHVAPGAPAFTATLGRIGYAARALVFALVGWSLVQSALSGREGEARDLGGVLADLSGSGLLYTLVTLGLLIFGIYSLILSRWRIVPRVDVVDAGKRKIEGAAGTARS